MLPVGASVFAPPVTETMVAVAVSVVPSAVIVAPELSVVVTTSSCVPPPLEPFPLPEVPPVCEPPPD